ncbi:O-acetyltransferase OatA [Pandoraea horticolens]|uniref:O-acetyltransferase OatA n=1 Tax=Pandoraea horticolens TaxID=2508298 RepID=A0A5E4Z5S6_9BURK|nr:acyltransferase family protein [Pandoraea horticolens]VVE55855.1 O-acetyltransferase OatA [Pandoraea horticolens]
MIQRNLHRLSGYPLLIFAAWRLRRNVLSVLVLQTTVSFLLNVQGVKTDPVRTFFLPQTRFWELLAGSFLAYAQMFEAAKIQLLQGKFLARGSGDLARNTLSIAGIVLVIGAVFGLNSNMQFPGWWAVLPVAGSFLLLLAGPTAWINRTLLDNRVMVFVGIISYPLYLWHWPILSFLRIIDGQSAPLTLRLVAVGVSILLAWLTYRLVERPIRLGGNASAKTIALCAVALFAVAMGYGNFLSAGFPSRRVAMENSYASTESQFKSNAPSTCGADPAFAGLEPVCTKYLAAGATQTVFLWGDSSAEAWSPVFRQIAYQRNINVIVISHPSCLPIIGVRETSFEFPLERQYCSDGKTGEKVLHAIRASKPSAIFLIGAWDYFGPFHRSVLTDSPDDTTATRKTTLKALSDKIPATLNALSNVAHLVVFKSWPILISDPDYGVVRLPFLGRTTSRELQTNERHEHEGAFINEIFAKSNVENTTYFDPSRAICSTVCATTKDGVRLYSDRYHITAAGSILFEEEIAKLMPAGS